MIKSNFYFNTIIRLLKEFNLYNINKKYDRLLKVLSIEDNPYKYNTCDILPHTIITNLIIKNYSNFSSKYFELIREKYYQDVLRGLENEGYNVDNIKKIDFFDSINKCCVYSFLYENIYISNKNVTYNNDVLNKIIKKYCYNINNN